MLEIAGIAVTVGALLYQHGGAHLGIIICVCIGVCLVGSFAFRSFRGAIFSFMVGVSVLCGGVAMWHSDGPVEDELFGKRAFDATVLSVDRRLSSTRVIVSESDFGARVQLFLNEKIKLLPGDRISVQGDVEAPEAFLTDTGRVFDYPAYLKSKKISAVMMDPMVRVQEEGNASVMRMATMARFHIANVFSLYMTYPADGVVAGMTVGYQGGLAKDIQDLFRDTGVLHVLVLSGYNITLLAGFLMVALRSFSFRARVAFTVVAIVALVVISGSGVAGIRAGIMGSIALLAGLALRTYQPLRALTVAYLIFFFVSPTALFADPGFHLSFLATGFMVLILPKAERLFAFIPNTKVFSIREILMLAFLVPLFMLPYMMYFSGMFPLVAPFSNILLSVVTPIAMIGGIAVVAFSWTAPVAHILGSVVGELIQGVLGVLEKLHTLPVWHTPEIPWWVIFCFYSVLLGVLFKNEIRVYVWHVRKVLQPDSSSYF